MKLKYIYGSYLLLVLACFSCKQEEKFDYVAGNQLFFNVSDSVTYSFAIKSSTLMNDILNIPVGTSGFLSNKDREVALREDPSKESTAIAGTHYSIGKAIIKAGQYTVDVPITVFRKPELSTKEVVLYLELVTNQEYLGDLGAKKLQLKVKINNILTPPSNWDSYIKRYFGTYGPVKYQFIIDTLGIYEFYETGENPISKAQMAFYKDKLKAELIKKGPLYEEGTIKVDFDI